MMSGTDRPEKVAWPSALLLVLSLVLPRPALAAPACRTAKDEISQMISQLGDQDPDSRDRAVRQLKDKGAHCFFHHWDHQRKVLGLLSHPDQRTRADVGRLLVKTDRNFTLGQLISLLRNECSLPFAEGKTRCMRQVLDALALLRPASGVAIPFVMELLSASSIDITLDRAARKTLQQIVPQKEHAIFDFMEGLLSQDQSRVKGRPRAAKGQPRTMSGRALEAAGRRALPLIIKWMKRADPLVHRNTCYLQDLSKRHLAGRRWAAAILLRSVRTLPSRFQNTSLTLDCALENLGPVLIPLVSKDLTRRGLARPRIAFKLMFRLSPQDLRPLIPDLQRALRVHGGTSLVAKIVRLLGQAHPPASSLIPRLIRAYQDFGKESQGKKNCCDWKGEVFSTIHDVVAGYGTEALPFLIPLLQSKTITLRTLALNSLGRLGEEELQRDPDLARQVVQVLTSSLKSTSELWAILEIFSRMGKLARPAEGALRELLQSGTHDDNRAEIEDLLAKIHMSFEQEVIGRLARTAAGKFRIDRATLQKVISRSLVGADGAVMVMLTARLVFESRASGVRGLTVSVLAPVSVLNQLGVKQGDRVVSLNGVRLESAAALRRALGELTSSDQLSFKMKRGARIYDLQVEVSR